MEVYIFDKALNFVGLLEGYYSFTWTRKYNSCGEFEIHCSVSSDFINLLKVTNVVWKNDDNEAGYIQYRELKQDKEGNEILIVKGRFLTNYLSQRIVWNAENIDANTESIIRTLVSNNCINSTEERKIPLLLLSELKNYGSQVKYKSNNSNLLTVVEALAKASDLGLRTIVDMNNKTITFDVYIGVDRSSKQSVNDLVVFSSDFENVLKQEYTESIANQKNVALISSEETTAFGSDVGLDRFELYIDASDMKKENMTTAEYIEKLKERANIDLADYSHVRTFESKVNIDSNLKYKEDFDLGDIVTNVSKKWGITLDSRITEIEEVYEEDGLSINVTFGESAPTLLKRIRQVVK